MTLVVADHPTPHPSDPIGVFDSGVGGLSVLKALRVELPAESFVYVADSGHAPYGERDDAHVLQRSHAVARYLQDHHRIKALVVACNTATAAAIAQLRQSHANLPIIGIEPALKPAATQSRTHTIGVMATRGTLGSEKFRRLLSSLQGQGSFVLQPCDGLANAIECADATKIVAYCTQYTGAMGPFGLKPGEIDTLVLGCTHYPFAAEQLRTMVGKDVVFLEGGAPVARQVRRVLAERGVLRQLDAIGLENTSPLQFFTTGSAKLLSDTLHRWLNLQAQVKEVGIAHSSA